MNGQVTPKDRICIRNELLEIKQEGKSDETAESIPLIVNDHTEIHIKQEPDVVNVPNEDHTGLDGNISGLQTKINDLNEEKKKVIADLISLKSENQQLYFNSKRNEEQLRKKIEVEKKLELSVKSLEEKNAILSAKYEELNGKYADLNALKEAVDEQFRSHLLKCEKEIHEYKQTIARVTEEKNTLVEQNQPVSSSSESDSDTQMYNVSKIIDHKITNRKRYFLVRWEGYGAEADSWEPENNLKNLSAFKSYLKKNSM